MIQARSSVCNPNSPKSMRRLREAVPLRLPRWVFRYFTRLGINGIANPSCSYSKIMFPSAPGRVRSAGLRLQAAASSSYRSSTLLRFCHRRCSLRQSRNRSACAEVCSGTLPSRYHSEREISAPFNRPELRRRIPCAPKSIATCTAFSSRGDKRFDARSGARRFRPRAARRAPGS